MLQGRSGGAVLGVCALLAGAPAWASSQFVHGKYVEADPDGPSYHDQGTCNFITGPRDGMAGDQFILTAGDDHAKGDTELQLTGTFTATSTKKGKTHYALRPDPAAAGKFVEAVLRRQLNDSSLTFLLTGLTAEVNENSMQAKCSVKLTGTVDTGQGTPATATLSFAGTGLYYPGGSLSGQDGAKASPIGDKRADTAPNCPTSDLAPLGLAPVSNQCTPGTSCIVNFKGYQWWTSFQYYGAPGNPVFPWGGYFYNGGLATAFAPSNAFLKSDGLHLQVQKKDLGGGLTTAGAEVVLMFNPDGSPVNLGYGDYLVTATVPNASDFGALDPNVAFGVFPFERVGQGGTGDANNPAREIDLAEVSTWGKYPPGQCPYTGITAPLCTGNAQFTLQIWDKFPKNLHRYTFTAPPKTITLVMRWHAAQQPVTFEEYNGSYDFSSLPSKADVAWTSAADQNAYVPAHNCERFHMNLWLGNFPAGKGGPNPGPATYPQEVVVTNFQFQPAQ
jgi:hypothetical protein